MGASMLLAETGIDTDEVMENSAAYCASWIATIREDPKIIVRAASQGAKITDLVMEPYREAHPIAELEGDADAEDQGEDAEYERAAQALRAEYDAQVAEVQADEPELEMA
jgi:antirestriction protein ArdC